MVESRLDVHSSCLTENGLRSHLERPAKKTAKGLRKDCTKTVDYLKNNKRKKETKTTTTKERKKEKKEKRNNNITTTTELLIAV